MDQRIKAAAMAKLEQSRKLSAEGKLAAALDNINMALDLCRAANREA